MGKNDIIFGVENTSSVHIDNKTNDILVLGKGLTQGLPDTMVTAEPEHSINFSRSRDIFCLSLQCNNNKRFLLVNPTKMYLLKTKNS